MVLVRKFMLSLFQLCSFVFIQTQPLCSSFAGLLPSSGFIDFGFQTSSDSVLYGSLHRVVKATYHLINHLILKYFVCVC